MAPMYILARDIDDRKTTAAMRLRLGSYVHLNILGNNVSAANSFIEGHVYCLKNFLVISPIYTYRTCSSAFMLQYYHKTLVKQYKGLDFPRKMFRLQPFDSIKSLEGIDPKVLIDVIGRVVHIFSPLDKLINGRPSKLIDFVIEDFKGFQLKCTVWDQHVEKVMPFCQYDLKEPVIVLIQMCRVKVPENSGEVKICSSYDATQLLFNHECDECTDFRDRLCNQPTPLKSITSNSSLSYSTYTLGDQSSSNMVFSTISELYERSETGEYWVSCIILELDCNFIDWYYLSCISGRCNKKVDLKGGMYVCGKCGTHCDTPKLRYKIKLRVYDAKGSAPFLLWDPEALELLGGITAEELKAMQPKVPTKISKEIVSLVGRGMLFKINVERDRLEKRNLAFPIMQIKDDIAVVNEGFFSDEEAESPLPNPLTQVSKGGANDSEAVKRRLLDEFSSTQVSKKKTHTMLIKVEKDSELAKNENSLGHDNSNPTLQSQLSSYKTPSPFCGVFQASLSTPLSVLTNGYTECITNLVKKPSSRLMNANNGSPSDCRNLHNDFNECSEQEDTVTDAQPSNFSPHFFNIW
nr:replication protein A 70 kDa DNA-binding subunit B-like [Ipomoea batatas]